MTSNLKSYLISGVLLYTCICNYIAYGLRMQVKSQRSFINIRGHPTLQRLPTNLIRGWQSWTLENENILEDVENVDEDEGWLDPTTFSSLYLPADLPPPKVNFALGVGISKGAARYIMPSIVLSLETPGKKWRNRGLCSLPRSWAWIDLFAENTPPITSLQMTYYGRNIPNLRFLEDIDGSNAWESLLKSTPSQTITAMQLQKSLQQVQSLLLSPVGMPLQDGFHFVDVLIPNVESVELPQQSLRAYLTDLEDTERLLEFETPELLDGEPCAELDIDMMPIAPGRDSPFLPEVYQDLYEEGSIISR